MEVRITYFSTMYKISFKNNFEQNIVHISSKIEMWTIIKHNIYTSFLAGDDEPLASQTEKTEQGSQQSVVGSPTRSTWVRRRSPPIQIVKTVSENSNNQQSGHQEPSKVGVQPHRLETNEENQLQHPNPNNNQYQAAYVDPNTGYFLPVFDHGEGAYGYDNRYVQQQPYPEEAWYRDPAMQPGWFPHDQNQIDQWNTFPPGQYAYGNWNPEMNLHPPGYGYDGYAPYETMPYQTMPYVQDFQYGNPNQAVYGGAYNFADEFKNMQISAGVPPANYFPYDQNGNIYHNGYQQNNIVHEEVAINVPQVVDDEVAINVPQKPQPPSTPEKLDPDEAAAFLERTYEQDPLRIKDGELVEVAKKHPRTKQIIK